MWSDILLILISAFGAVYISFSLDDRHTDSKNVLIFSLCAAVIFQINQFLEYSFISMVDEVLVLIIFTAILAMLLLTIRKLKPAFARYPLIVSYSPFFIVILYPLIAGETSIIQLVLQLTQSAGLIALLFIIVSQIEIKKLQLLALLTFILLLSAGIIFWADEMINIGKWLWQTLTAIGIGVGSYAICQFYNQNETIKNYATR